MPRQEQKILSTIQQFEDHPLQEIWFSCNISLDDIHMGRHSNSRSTTFII